MYKHALILSKIYFWAKDITQREDMIAYTDHGMSLTLTGLNRKLENIQTHRK